MYYVSLIRWWHPVMILVSTDHPYLRVGHHIYMMIVWWNSIGCASCMRKKSTNCQRLKDSNLFFALPVFAEDFISKGGWFIYDPSVWKKHPTCHQWRRKVQYVWLHFSGNLKCDISNNRLCAYAPYIMKMIEKISKKTFVNNVEHTKL
jgi:hypothetical protein